MEEEQSREFAGVAVVVSETRSFAAVSAGTDHSLSPHYTALLIKVFEHGENSVAIAFAGANYELYAVLDSMNSVSSAVAACSRVIRWLRKEEQSGRLATPIVMWEQ